MFSYILSWYSVLSKIAICPIKQNLFSAKIYALHFFNASLVLWLTWCEELTHWKRPWCWEVLKVGGEGDNRGWDGWMASLTWWTWVWASFRSWWWTGKPGIQQSMGCKKLDMTQWLNWTEVSNMASWVALVVKNLSANAGDPRKASSAPASGRSPGGWNSNSFQYSCLENSMYRGAWRATVHGVTKSQTCLSTHSI